MRTRNTAPAVGGLEGSSVVVLDRASGAELYRIDRAYAYRSYGLDGPSRCAGIQRYDPATETWYTDLYDPDTRTMYSRFETFCGENLICYQPEPGRYDVCALGETEPLASYDGPCSYWREGRAPAPGAGGGGPRHPGGGAEERAWRCLTTPALYAT